MAVRLEISKRDIENAIDKEIASLKRAKNTARSPEFEIIYETAINRLTQARANITEIK